MLSLGIKYSTHDLFSVFNYCVRYASYNVSFFSFLLCKLWIPRLKKLLDENSSTNLFYLYLLSIFPGFQLRCYHYTLILPISQLQTHWLMTSQSRSHIEYSVPTDNILMLLLHTNFTQRNRALSTLIDKIQFKVRKWLAVLAHPVSLIFPHCDQNVTNGCCLYSSIHDRIAQIASKIQTSMQDKMVIIKSNTNATRKHTQSKITHRKEHKLWQLYHDH